MYIKNIYWLGGSPCSGKSTVAELMAQRLGMDYFKLDDLLDQLMNQAAESGGKACAASLAMSPDQIWMRDPAEQCREEFEIYREIFPFALEKLTAAAGDRPVITEGAGWLPDMVQSIGVEPSRYICLVPSRVFQITEYSRRPWIDFVLEQCKDREAAFSNWMERDVIFARQTAAIARRLHYKTIVNDGSLSIEDLYSSVIGQFGLEN